MPYLGAHESIAGGLYRAFDRIEKVGGEALQIFTRNQRQWYPPPLSGDEILRFKETWAQHDAMPTASHASYLINLGSGKQPLARQSILALADEMKRCDELGIPWLVLHPGSHGGAGVAGGLENVSRNLDAAFDLAGGKSAVMVLLETTAGQVPAWAAVSRSWPGCSAVRPTGSGWESAWTPVIFLPPVTIFVHRPRINRLLRNSIT